MQVLNSPAQARRMFANCVATIGKYDGMHLGHQRILDTLLERAGEQGLPAVVILSEPQPEEFFNGAAAPPRLNHFQDKVAFLDSYGIDAVYQLQFDHALSQQEAEAFVRRFLVAELGAKALVIGDDFRFGRNRGGDIELLRALGNELGMTVEAVAPCSVGPERVSSTLVRQYLQAGDCAKVAQLLGRPYAISGTIVQGRQLGRQIGVPTANLELHGSGLPLSGVFAVRAELASGGEYEGVANLGYKPTVSAGVQPSLEVHLFDFDRDVYGETMTVKFLHKIRPEQKFAGLPELQQQIARDIGEARGYFARDAMEAQA